MSRFLGNIAARAMGQAPLLQPRPRSRHEDVPLSDPFRNQDFAGKNEKSDQATEVDLPNGKVEVEDAPLAADPASPQGKSNPSPGFVQPRTIGENRIEGRERSEEQNDLAPGRARLQADFIFPITEESKNNLASDRFSEPAFLESYPASPVAPDSNQESAGPWFASDPEALRGIPAALYAPGPLPLPGASFPTFTPATSQQPPSQPKEMVIQVHIGRIEVKAPADPVPKSTPTPSRASGLSLQHYLARRNGGQS